MNSRPILAIVSIVLSAGTLVADHDAAFRDLDFDLEGYSCDPCREMGYVDAFEKTGIAYVETLERVDELDARRSTLEAQHRAKTRGRAVLVADLEQAKRNIATLNRELAPMDREEEGKGFGEIDTLQARKIELQKAGRKLSNSEKKRLQNLKKKRADFRKRRRVAGKNKTRQRFLSTITALEEQIDNIENLPPASTIKADLDRVSAKLRGERRRLDDATERYLVAKRELIFCTSYYELERLRPMLRQRRIPHELPYGDE